MISILVTALLICTIINREITCLLKVNEISKFPYFENSPFHLQILPERNNEKLNKFPTETMVIAVSDKNNIILEKYVFNYGYQYAIDEELIGNFIDIPLWQRDINSTIINVTIQFKKDSNLKFIEIFHLPANTTEIRRKMFKNLKIANRIYSKRIKLLIPSKLELFVKSINQSNDELLFHNEIAIAVCRAFNGISKEKPIFTNHKLFNVTKNEYNIERNEQTLWFNVSMLDHLKNLTCRAGHVSQSTTIFVTKNMMDNKVINYLQFTTEIINKKIHEFKQVIKGLFDENKKYNERKTVEMKNITQSINLLHNNLYSMINMINMKINYMNNSFSKMKIENLLYKQKKNPQIDQLLKNVDVLMKDNFNTNEKIKILIEKINKLNETNKFNIGNTRNNVINQITTIPTNTHSQNTLTYKYDQQFNWTVDNLSEFIKNSQSDKKTFLFKNIDNIYRMNYFKIWYWVRKDYLKFKQVVKLYKSYPLPKQLISSVEIIDKNNKSNFKILTVESEIYSTRIYPPDLTFDYQKLSQLGILKSNSIIIRCSLLWIK